MRTSKKLFKRTERGERALRCKDRRLPRSHRTVLARIEGVVHSDRVPERRLVAALEARGLVESVKVEWLVELFRLAAYEPTPLITH